MMHKAGFVNIIGLPNVGKSTLLNALLGEKLSIVSPKAQTTRQRILGIVNQESYQIVFSDTPGFVNQPSYQLHHSMNASVKEALEDADLLLLVTDKYQKNEEQEHFVKLMQATDKPVMVLINKVDLYTEQDTKQLITKWQQLIPRAEVIPLSATTAFNKDWLTDKIAAILPENPPYYDKDQITDRNMRFYAADMVREKIFLHYQKEIPYACQVIVEEYKEEANIDKIKCSIFVERESQKAILIGNRGDAIKKIGIEAREEIEKLAGKKVYLELQVKIKDKWRNDPNALQRFGY